MTKKHPSQLLVSRDAAATTKGRLSPIALSFIALGCILTGIACAIFLRSALPEHNLAGDAKDVVRLCTGLIGTIAALVLGLLIASAKTSHDTQSAQVRQMTANVILLDHLLAQYGEEARASREVLRRVVVNLVDRVWHDGRVHLTTPFEASSEGEAFNSQI